MHKLRIESEAAQCRQCLAWEEDGWCVVYPKCASVSFIAHHYLPPELFCHHFITIICAYEYRSKAPPTRGCRQSLLPHTAYLVGVALYLLSGKPAGVEHLEYPNEEFATNTQLHNLRCVHQHRLLLSVVQQLYSISVRRSIHSIIAPFVKDPFHQHYYCCCLLYY